MSLGATPLAVLAWLWTAVLHGTLLMAAALALAPRVRSLWWRERLLRTAFFGGFATAALACLGHEPLLGRFSIAPAAERAAAILPPAAKELALDRAALPGALDAQQLARATAPSPAATEPAALPPPPRSPIDLGEVLARAAPVALGLWALCGALALARTLQDLLRLRRSLRERAPLHGPVAWDLAALRRRARVYEPVRLTVSEGTGVPITIGLVRREICLPRRALDAFTRAELRAVLAHELAHTQRRDTLWFVAYALVVRAFPFLPLARRVRRELLATAELDCDDLAVSWTGTGLELASSLTEIARWLVAGGERLPVPTMARESSRLGQRVLRLLEEPRRERRPRRALARLCALGALGAVGALAPALGAAEETAAERAAAPRAALARHPAAELPAPAPEPPHASEALAARMPGSPAERAAAPGATASSVPVALQLDQELLAGEMAQLSDELAHLTSELGALHRPHLARTARALEERLDELERRRQRASELLERLFAAPPTDVGGAPRADVPTESP